MSGIKCLYDDRELLRRQMMGSNPGATGIHYLYCAECGRMFDDGKNIIDENGNRLNDNGEPMGETTP